VQLEVTVQNTGAVRLYERLGFKRVETLFKIAEVVTV
jgi:ribosomal protein S18 acetylase RimI-like enzyme